MLAVGLYCLGRTEAALPHQQHDEVEVDSAGMSSITLKALGCLQLENVHPDGL